MGFGKFLGCLAGGAVAIIAAPVILPAAGVAAAAAATTAAGAAATAAATAAGVAATAGVAAASTAVGGAVIGAAATVGAVATAPVVTAVGGAVAVGKGIKKMNDNAREEGRKQGRAEAKADLYQQLEDLKNQIETNSKYKSAQERDKIAIYMCGIAVAFASNGGAITEKEKKVIETVICGKAGMTSAVKEKLNQYYNMPPNFFEILKATEDSKLVNMKDIQTILVTINNVTPDKNCKERNCQLDLIRNIA